MNKSAFKTILICVLVLVIVFALGTAFTGARYVYEEQYTFTIITSASGYSFMYAPAPDPKAKTQTLGISLQNFGANRINVFNNTNKKITKIAVRVNYLNTSSTASNLKLRLYSSSGIFIQEQNLVFAKNKKSATNVTSTFSSLSLLTGDYVYAEISGTPTQPNLITINNIRITVTY